MGKSLDEKFVATLGAAGWLMFFFPPMWPVLLLAFVGWLVAFRIQDARDAKDPSTWDQWDKARRSTAADPEWPTYWVNLCESPAEEQFLKAMIERHGLIPTAGKLQGGGVTLDLQVKIDCYRVDFLLNDRFIVEIDGATYHSSPEAIERDKQRDARLGNAGFKTLRIPAQVVFGTPGEATRRVDVFLGRIVDATSLFAEVWRATSGTNASTSKLANDLHEDWLEVARHHQAPLEKAVRLESESLLESRGESTAADAALSRQGSGELH